ncbi:MAG TPA: ABC transporter permease [Longimicrobiales bacterium]
MSWFDGARARLRLLFARRGAEERMEEEFRFHLDMEAERLVREAGLDPREARRRALIAFGGRDRYREEMRDGRGLAWLTGLRLDLKLGARMVLKYPMLTLASVSALAVAMALAASWFEFVADMAFPRIPLEDGDRIVTVRNRDLATTDRDYPSEPRSLHDFEAWREQVRTIEDLGAASPVEYVVATEDGRYATLEGMRVTPSVFRVAGVAPLLGRTFTEADMVAGAPPVVVLGYAAWQRLFDGDRSAVGRMLRLGSEHATVVGVMPEGFAFPVNEEVWTPLRERAVDYPRRAGPPITIVGRLAPGVTLEQAQAELATIGQRTAAEFPETHARLRPEVRRFARGSDDAAVAAGFNVPFVLLLVVVSANVAALLVARTATREGEVALRSALGASRRRIVVQLVAEALVLTAPAAALALAAARWGLGWGMELFWEVQQSKPPFWFDSGLSTPTVLYVCGLAALGALIAGGIPGLRATRSRLWHRLPQPGAGGDGMRFGVLATGIIIVQVALCVAFIPVAIMNGRELLRGRGSTDFPAASFLTVRLLLQRDPAAPAAGAAGATGATGAGSDVGRGFADRPGGRGTLGPAETPPFGESGGADPFDEARRRLAAEPGVVAATRVNRLPGFNHPVSAIEIVGDTARIVDGRRLAVDPNFFDVVGARIVAGRPFHEGDVTAAADVAIVDEAWAEQVFGGRSPLGRRLRYPTREGERGSREYEIVGVVAGMDRAIGPGTSVAVYHPLRPAEHASVQFYLRTAGPPEAVAPRVLSLIPSVDARLGVADVQPLDDVWRPVQRSDAFFAAALAAISAIILLFALIGIYALTSFTVARRAREIGIRAALGAGPRRIIAAIFSRALIQIGAGVVAGAALVSLTVAREPDGLRLVGGVAAVVVAVGLLGCIVPAARALRIEPTEALRAE